LNFWLRNAIFAGNQEAPSNNNVIVKKKMFLKTEKNVAWDQKSGIKPVNKRQEN
jgi:hypothetical protein